MDDPASTKSCSLDMVRPGGIWPVVASRPVRLLSHLREIDHGEFVGLTSDEIEATWPGMLAQRAQRKFEWKFPGGESYREASRRVTLALGEIGTGSSRRPNLIAHEMIGRMSDGDRRVTRASPR